MSEGPLWSFTPDSRSLTSSSWMLSKKPSVAKTTISPFKTSSDVNLALDGLQWLVDEKGEEDERWEENETGRRIEVGGGG